MSNELKALMPLDLNEVVQSIQGYEQGLAQMDADYLPLLDIPITDKKQLEVVKAARMNFKNTRLEGVSRLDAGCKAAHANHQLWVKARDSFEAKFSQREEKFRAKEKEFEEAQEREFLRIAQEEQRRVAARKERMFQIGFKFDGSKYVLEGFAELTENEVSGLGVDDLQLGEWLSDMERQVAEHKERQAEEERTRRIAAEALAAEQRKRDEEAAAKLQEIERREKEMAEKERQMNAKVNEARKNELIAAGCVVGTNHRDEVVGARIGADSWGHLSVIAELHMVPEDVWPSIVQRYKEEVEMYVEAKRQREEEARIQREKDEQERIAREKQLQEEAAQKAVEAERLRIAQEQEEKEKAQKLLEEQEREKALQASDKEKVLNYGVKVSVLISEIPQLKSAVGTSAMKSYEKNLRDLANSLSKLSQEL